MRHLLRHQWRPGLLLPRRRRPLVCDCGAPSRRPLGGNTNTAMIRVIIPVHLRTIAGTGNEVLLDVKPPVTQRSILDALEAAYPVLEGTIRDHVTKKRRP